MASAGTPTEHYKPALATHKRRRPIAPWILAVLLLAMAAGQLFNFGGFVEILETYRVGPTAVAAALGLALVVGEATGGILLLTRPARRATGAAVALVVTIAWSLLALVAFVQGLHVPNCGCFGLYFSQELRWWVLLEDVEFVALAAVVLRREVEPRPF